MKFLLSSFFSVLLLGSIVAAQSLPPGKWRLEEYRFGSTTEHTLKGVQTTLVVKSDGKLGGDSGCNAYGGSYSTDNGKLKIADIISTMRACEEPSPTFESGFFDVLEKANSAKVEGDALVIFDKDSRYLRFVRDGEGAN
ncbi:MAG TPA: META domain-containing protein [Pyrinomonadaceae bacterium]